MMNTLKIRVDGLGVFSLDYPNSNPSGDDKLKWSMRNCGPAIIIPQFGLVIVELKLRLDCCVSGSESCSWDAYGHSTAMKYTVSGRDDRIVDEDDLELPLHIRNQLRLFAMNHADHDRVGSGVSYMIVSDEGRRTTRDVDLAFQDVNIGSIVDPEECLERITACLRNRQTIAPSILTALAVAGD